MTRRDVVLMAIALSPQPVPRTDIRPLLESMQTRIERWMVREGYVEKYPRNRMGGRWAKKRVWYHITPKGQQYCKKILDLCRESPGYYVNQIQTTERRPRVPKRLECEFCPAEKGEHTVQRDGVTTTVIHVFQPKFRGRRQLARHLQERHPDNKKAQGNAVILLAEAKDAARRNRKEQKYGKR